MFKSKDAGYSENVDTIIGANTEIEGNIKSRGSVRVDGKVKGDIEADGDVLIGVNAVITGNISAAGVNISGTVEGNVRSTALLRIMSTARLYGDIEVRSFVADEGGIFQGKCSMLDVQDAPSASESSGGKKSHNKNYKKSSVIEQIYEEKKNKSDAG